MISDKEFSFKMANMAFVCQLLVLTIHVPCRMSLTIDRCVHEFFTLRYSLLAVPFFFFAAAFWLSKHVDGRGWWLREIRKRVSSLLIPYAIWNVLFFLVFWRCLSKVPDLMIRMVSPFWYPYNAPLWFIKVLFVLIVMSFVLVPILRRFVASRIWLGVIAILYVAYWIYYGYVGVYPSDFGIHGDWRGIFYCGPLSFEAIFYFSLGLFCGLRRDKFLALISSIRFGRIVLLGALGLCITVGALFVPNGETYMRPVMIPFNACALFLLVPTTKLPAFLVGSSFYLYLSQTIVIGMDYVVWGRLGYHGVIWRQIFVVFACLLSLFVLRKLPVTWLHKLLLGGR